IYVLRYQYQIHGYQISVGGLTIKSRPWSTSTIKFSSTLPLSNPRLSNSQTLLIGCQAMAAMLAQSLKFLPVSRPRKSRQAASRLIGWDLIVDYQNVLIRENRIKTCAPSTYFSIKMF